MPRESLERDLKRLEDEILDLGAQVVKSLVESVDMLKQRDLEGSRRIMLQDRVINQKRFAIETECLITVATQQPMASDLRVIAAILHINDELERMGDYAKGIGKISLMIGTRPLIKPLVDIPRMAEKASSMLRRSLQAFAQRDVVMARMLPAEDDEVDALFDQVNRELLTYIMGNPSLMEQANLLLWVAHNLERTADRVTNICERVIFTVTGELVEIENDHDTAAV
ncbi:MAG: phosphate signaling complex protein PhoU [Chloroflexi bacterium]|nr:phosphate signaling complex protein PhoU [Chloroflexota bacterium]